MPVETIATIKDLLMSLDINIDDIKTLPICFTRTHEQISNIVAKRENLIPQKSEDYDEDLLFFFYGKAKYIPIDQVETIYMDNDPITLIYSIKKPIRRFVCFDSGGYERYNMGDLDRSHFEIENCEIDLIKKYIKTFYESNNGYVDKRFIKILKKSHYPLCKALHGLYRLANIEGKVPYGEQAFTIEIQFDEEFELDPDVVVAPMKLLSSDAGREQMKSTFNNAEMEVYKDEVEVVFSYYNMGNVVKDTIKEMMK